MGLGNVDNFATATQADAEGASRNDVFMTPVRVAQEVAVLVGNAFNAHVNNSNNPHGTTKVQVGLGNVDNFATSNESDARAGTRNDLFMTPLRVAQAINTQAGALINAHVNNTNNPHNTTAAQVGLGNVPNWAPVQPNEEYNPGINYRFMTPTATYNAIMYFVGNNYNAHAARTDNPHATNKVQVGLGQVDNFLTASTSDVISGTRNDMFVTPLGVKAAITASQQASNIQVDNSEWGYEYNPTTKNLKCWGTSPTMYEGWCMFFWFRFQFSRITCLTYETFSATEVGGEQGNVYQQSEITSWAIKRTVGTRGFGVVCTRSGGQNADSVTVQWFAEGYADNLNVAGPTPYTNCTINQFYRNLNEGNGWINGGMNAWNGIYPVNAQPSGGGGGSSGGSVSVLACMPHTDKSAGDMVAGDPLSLLDVERNGTTGGAVVSNRLSEQNLVRLVSESGIFLTVSDNTPLTLENGMEINSSDALGVRLPVQDENGFRWERIIAVEPAGRGMVATIFCDNQCYAAGDEPGRYIWTHNATNVKT